VFCVGLVGRWIRHTQLDAGGAAARFQEAAVRRNAFIA
jgi:hypothetical protein